MKRLACPSCRRSDQVSVIEVHEEWGETDPGIVYLDDHGALIPPSEFIFSPGDPILVRANCSSCRHEWRPRTQRVSSELPPFLSE